MGEIKESISGLLLSNRKRTRYLGVLAVLAVVVSLGVAAVLHRTGVAMTHEETVLDCQYTGNGAHTHDASCYDADGNLVCPLEEKEYHVHDDSCYTTETYLVCGLEEGAGAHYHEETCYDEEGNLVCGLEESEGHVHTDECWASETTLTCGKEEVTEEHVHGDGCFKTITVVDEEPAAEAEAEAEPTVAAAAEEPEPAADAEPEVKEAAAEVVDTTPVAAAPTTTEAGEQTFTGELKDANGNVVVAVNVKAPAGALPEGAYMEVKALDADEAAAVAAKVDEAVKAETGGAQQVKSSTTVDITFRDANGNEVEPTQKVEVKITSATVRDADAPMLVHVDKYDNAEILREVAVVNADENDTTTGNEDTLKFDTDSFSPFTVVETEPVTEDEQAPAEAAVAMPAQTFRGEAGDIKVVASAPKGAFAEGTTMTVAPVESDDIIEAVGGAVEGTVDKVAAVDITFWSAEGEQVQPLVPIKVTMTNAAAPAQGEPVVVHVDDEGAASVVEQTAATNGSDTAIFKADSFSVYAMVITTQYISATGEAYDVTVTYGADAQLPEGAWLSVTEFAEGTPEWEAARNAVLADKLAKGEYVAMDDFGFAALDISIMDADGNEIEPAAEVQVDMKLKSLPEVEDLAAIAEELEVQHHVETEDGVIVETVVGGETEASFALATNEDVVAAKADEAVDPASFDEAAFEAIAPETVAEELETSFDTEVFSTFTITWRGGGRTVTVHYVDESGRELTIANPDNTHQNMNANSSSPAFLIYDIEGYTYQYTYRNTNNNQNRISPLLGKNGNNRWLYNFTYQYNQWGQITGYNGTELSNGDNIYVVYSKDSEPSQGGTPQVDVDETWPEGNDAPQFGKSSTNNGNGTNTISLSIVGGEKPVEKSTPADVIVVFDVSGSMSNNMDGQTRLARAKTAVNTMANTLLNGDNHDVRMALISFSTTAQQVNIPGATNGFTSNYNNFSSAVNGLQADGGTNWEQALELANHMQVRSDAATFVVFVTDGDPTFRVSRGDVANNNLDMYTGTSYTYYRNNNVFGEGNGDSDGRNFDFAVDQVSAIAGVNKNFYAIGISNDVTKVQNLTTQGGVAADHAFIASNTAAMEAAFKSITESIKSILGFGDLEITDGITALTNAEMKVMQSVDPASFTYYRYGGGENGDKYGADYAHKQEWTTREADGCAAAGYSEQDGAVHWNMGETFQLEDGVTYVVEFIVWPSQAAYDLVADLNNGLKTYDSLTEAEKAQVVEVTPPTATTTGTYALKTNTDQVSATYNKTTKTGDTVTISDTTDVTATYHQGTLDNMDLDSDFITVKKEWHNALDDRVVGGITLTVTKDSAVYLDDLTLNPANNWTSDEQYISAGFITETADGRYTIRETGHEYTVTEPASFSYYWDLTADVYRPMVVNGELEMLVKTDTPTGTEGTDYFVIGGNSYQVSDVLTPQLTARNDRRSNLNLKKLVTADTQAVDNVPNPDDVFTYTITVTDVNGDAVWFGAQDASGATVLIESHSANVTAEVDADGNPTGSYSVPSGAQFTISIKADWNVRFFNLPTGTTYSIQETSMEDGYQFVKAETAAEVTDPAYAEDYKATPGTVDGDTVTGTIDQPNNVYSTEYTNNWNPNNEIVITKTDENGTRIAGAQFKLSKKAASGWTEIATFTSKADAGETLKVGRGLYMLEETTAPADYAATETVYFMVETNGNTTTVTLTDENGSDVDDEGEPIVYRDATASENEVTIKDWPLTTADATKAWKNADGTTTAPTGATVVFTLYIDGEASDYTVTLDGADDTAPTGTDAAGYESEGWKASFVNLPKYDLSGDEPAEIAYTIAETTTYPGYTASTTEPVASGETITNTQEATTANALKAWENADGTTTAPAGATVVYTLYADGTATTYTVTLDGTADTAPTGTAGYESEAWKALFINLPKYQAGTTTEIVYTVAETTTFPGYTPSTTDPVASGETITNKQGSTDTYATKEWKNADGTTDAPEGATVVFTLYSDGTETNYTVTLDGTADTAPTGTGGYESEAWKATFVKLPKSKIVDGAAVDIVYTIAETTTYPGYTPSTTEPVGSGSTITNTQEPTTANAVKEWVNADGTTEAPQGGQVTFTLYADGEATEYTVTLDGTADTAPETTGGYESEAWKAEFVNLPKYQTGTTTEIVYTIAETGTFPGYTASTTDPVASGQTITNTQEATEADALKAWKNADGTTTAPEGATVEFTLYADGTATDYAVTLDGSADAEPTGTAGYESEAWKALFVNLPKYKVVEETTGEGEDAVTTTNAVEIVYTVAETKAFPGYTPSTTDPVASGETITNTQDATTALANKVWKNADGSATAPKGATVEFTLYADSEKTEYAVTLDGTADETVPTGTAGYENPAWTATFVNLPKYKLVEGEAVEIIYTIAETETYPGYTASTTEPVASGESITNEQIAQDIIIAKVNTSGAPLTGAEFKLYSDEAHKNQVTKNATGDDISNIVVSTNEGFELGALAEGTYYLVETKAPAGYNLPTSHTVIKVSDTAVTAEPSHSVTQDSETGTWTIKIENSAGEALPHTGGPGTTIFTTIGAAVMASALVYGFSSRRRQEGRSAL